MAEHAKIVVVGAGYAGTFAALRAARRLRGRGEVLLIGSGPALVERVRLHEAAASGRDVRVPLARLLAGTGVRFVEGVVEQIDPSGRTVRVGGSAIAYDRAILATGGRSSRTAIAGAPEHARFLDDERAGELPGRLDEVARCGGRIAVVGGGLTGLETAAEIATRRDGVRGPRLAVALFSAGPLAVPLNAAGREHVHRALARHRVALHEGARVQRVGAGGRIHMLDRREGLTGAREVGFDAVLAAVGFEAQPLARASRLPVDEAGRVLVDAHLRVTDAPGVYAAGDAAWPLANVGGCWTMGCKSALPMAAHAADNAVASALGGPERPFRWRAVAFCVSLGRDDGWVQSVRADGTPGQIGFGGRAAAFVKERIVRSTIAVLAWERWLAAAGAWRRPAIAALATPPRLPEAPDAASPKAQP